MIFELHFKTEFSIELYRYHAKKHVEIYQAEDGWFYEGIGYYFTSMPEIGRAHL